MARPLVGVRLRVCVCVCFGGDRLEVVPSPVVWTDTLRVIGNLRQFSQHVFRLFGVVCDLGPKQLRRIAGFNLKESALERDRKKVWVGGCVDGANG